MKSLMTASILTALACVAGAADEPRPQATTLTISKGASLPVDARGFIHRWRVIEPIPVAGRLTESAVNEAIQAHPFPEADGAWHAIDTRNYNLNLYHFAWSLSKPTSNVLFWITTTVESPRDMRDVRLAIGSNAASRWWLDGELVIALNDDRQTVIDDGVSRRVTLHQGKNVIRAAIINGGGATDFCARFLDANDRPINGLVISTD
jgi:hypothetical protein